MKNSISEEDKIHSFSWIINVVLAKILTKLLWKRVKVIDSKIFLLGIAVVSKDSLLNLDGFPLKLETVLKISLENSEEPVPIFVIDQSVEENSLCFVNPETDQILFVGQRFYFYFKNSLENFTEISQVESIVRFSWGWKKLSSDFSVDLERTLHNRWGKLL